MQLISYRYLSRNVARVFTHQWTLISSGHTSALVNYR